MNLYKKGFKGSWDLLGPGLDFVYVSLVMLIFALHSAITWFSLFLDNFFFPGYRNIKVEKPVFIIGHPRSGTTFVHSLFNQTGETASFKAWHLLFPSLTARLLVAPVVNFLIRRNKTDLIPKEAGHHIALDKSEEEEMLFIHNHDTQFVIITTPLGFLDDEFRELRFHDLQPRDRRIRSAIFLKSLFQRQIYYTGNNQIFAQTHFSTHRIKTLMEVFPDAKFIYIDRSPQETLPSYFSLVNNVIDIIWGLHRFSTDQIKRFFEYRYRASLELYGYFHELCNSGEVDKERILIIPYNELKENLIDSFEKIVCFTDISVSPELRAEVEKQDEKQHGYQRAHDVRKLSDFGIDEDRMAKDFAFCK